MASVAGHERYGGRGRGRCGRDGLSSRLSRLTATLVVLAGIGATSAVAQIVPTPNPGRDCQTVRTCNFARGAAVRGCLSSYTCRICRTVRSKCSVGNRSQVCERIVCTWGG